MGRDMAGARLSVPGTVRLLSEAKPNKSVILSVAKDLSLTVRFFVVCLWQTSQNDGNFTFRSLLRYCGVRHRSSSRCQAPFVF
jgi:hypothetical protein